MWVCRTGYGEEYAEAITKLNMLLMPWDEYLCDLDNLTTMEHFRELVKKQKEVDNRTTISNWAGQLFAFSKKMDIGDYVMIPRNNSRFYSLIRIADHYQYLEKGIMGAHHSRKIELLYENIPREIFPQSMQYSLGAFRTLFQVKQDNEIISIINTWNKEIKL